MSQSRSTDAGRNANGDDRDEASAGPCPNRSDEGRHTPSWVMWAPRRANSVAGGRQSYGVAIGERCIVGAGAVVTKDLPDGSVAVGVPARVVRTLDAPGPTS